ncbi:MAG: phosphomannomutase/phosphoglucomutase [Candidatus Niyogibacteria bacterium]|nr:phosphomannomutase/phosphoglucomutase [Candidatus Niyogibacteria bacterium]
MALSEHIFKAYDIRGIYPEEINADATYRIGSAFCRYLLKKNKKKDLKIVVGKDARLSSPELCKAFINGCLDASADVLDIGPSTTPMIYFATNFLKADGGAIITASHNPSQYNGIKLVDGRALPINPSEIKKLCVSAPPKADQKGRLEKSEIASAYIDFLASFSHDGVNSAFRVVADASNGAGGELLKMLFDKLEVSYWPLYFDPDGRFPNHSPNPLEPEATQRVQELVIHKGADFGFVLDADGDRIVFLDERGRTVRGDLVTALLADNLAKKGDVVLMDVASGKIVFDIGKIKGVKIKRVQTGHLNIKNAMRKTNALLAGEASGHYYFRDFFSADSAALTLIFMLNIFAASRKTFSALLEPYDIYFHSREYNFKLPDAGRIEKILERLAKKYGEGKKILIDGLTVEYSDWWFNVRRSQTEPLLRLNIEAAKRSLLEEKIKELTTFVNKYQHSRIFKESAGGGRL